MLRFSFIECCQLLAIDPKTLRQWLAQAQMALQAHPRDARVKCLTDEQVHLLARLHGRVITAPVEELTTPFARSKEVPSRADASDADLHKRMAQMETQLATLQAQVTALALQLLKEREQRVLSLEAQVISHGDHAQAPPAGGAPSAPERSLLVCHPTEQRTPLVPLIEYGAGGRYVLICPKQGELSIIPDSPEWFAWLASLSSFRFVGNSGRFSARRGYNRRPNRCWYAQRRMHQKNYSKYIGVSERLTTERLEQVAASFQAYLP